jgi:hypothetical protein
MGGCFEKKNDFLNTYLSKKLLIFDLTKSIFKPLLNR